MEPQSSSTLSGLSTAPLPVKPSLARVEMVFRLWDPNPKGAELSSGHAAGNHPGVVALIEDVVSSKRGVLVATHDQLHVSGLKLPADALVVSRQVQLGVQGFRGRQGSAPIAVSIAIDANIDANFDANIGANIDASSGAASGAEPAVAPELKKTNSAGGSDPSPSRASTNSDAEPPHELITLLKLSKPAQILLTHDLCQQMAGIKGVPLKSFAGRFGVYEYLWTAEEKLDLLQSEPQLTLAALPVASPVTGSYPATNQKPDATAASGATKAFELANIPAAKSPDGMVQRVVSAFQQPRMLMFAALGLLALAAAIAVGIHLAHPPAAAPAPVSAPAAYPQTLPAMASPAVVAQPVEAKPAPTPVAKPHAGAKTRQVAGKSPAEASENPVPAQAAIPAPVPGCTLGMDAGRLVSLGEQSRGRGDYADAVRIFREVLACDPNNTAAREGLDKATQAQRQR